MCKIDVREGDESLVMIAATLKEISMERNGGGGVSALPLRGAGQS